MKTEIIVLWVILDCCFQMVSNAVDGPDTAPGATPWKPIRKINPCC